MTYDIVNICEQGPRKNNQDAADFRVIGNKVIACVADGVGGSNSGEVASSLAVKKFMKSADAFDTTADLKTYATQIHEQIITEAKQDPNTVGMATTFTGCVINSSILQGVHLGDSRLCILRGNGIKQLTEVHTELRRLLDQNLINEEDAANYPRKNLLESALGIAGPPIIQTFEFSVETGDRIILTTDGVHDIVTKKELRDASIMTGTSTDFSKAIHDLVISQIPKGNYTLLAVSIKL